MKLFSHIGTLAVGALIGAALAIYAPKLMSHHAQPYAGQDQRQISSLSASDVAALEKGEGWGLAKPAELNGYPGPAHVLEFAEELSLTEAQKQKVNAAFAEMKQKAVELGNALIGAEKALDHAFMSGHATPEILAQRLEITEKTRAALRAAHLAAHLEITPILTDDQRQRYAALRGYGAGDAHGQHGGH
jgi:Spy/CpxP family protein refolding chaperone